MKTVPKDHQSWLLAFPQLRQTVTQYAYHTSEQLWQENTHQPLSQWEHSSPGYFTVQLRIRPGAYTPPIREQTLPLTRQ